MYEDSACSTRHSLRDPELIWERQTVYKVALSGNPKDCLTLHARIPAPQRQLAPPFLATVDTLCSAAIETTITMDKLRGVPYRICAKEDRGRVFELRTKHEKQFCSYSCALNIGTTWACKTEVKQDIEREAD